MCGIFGTINYQLSEEDVFPHLVHRGPDAQSSFAWENTQLFHARLSIVDMNGGQQPMHYKQWTIIYNGEFYNHKEIREKYSLDCSTDSDTETLLKFFEKKGENCFDEIDGMFALAILDRNRNTIFIARDRAGKKPIYLYQKDRTVVFSSELNALKKNVPLEIDYPTLDKYLKGCIYGSYTPYLDVTEIEAGSFCTVDCDSLEVVERRWWRIGDQYQQEKIMGLDDSIQLLDQGLKNAVKTRLLQSDLEVGTFLSGGIDSGLVTSIAAELTPNIKSFTVRFPGEYDESPLAKLVADKYGTDHHEIDIDFKNLGEDFENIIGNYGEPFSDSSAIPSYYVAKEAKKHVTVVLNGDGADELFGGYRRHVAFSKFNLYSSPGYLKFISSILLKILPKTNKKKNLYNYLFRLLNLFAAEKDELYWYATSDTFVGYTENFKRQVGQFDEISQLLENNKDLTSLEKSLMLDFNILMCGVLLVKMDIATMSNSLEGRSPFLSKELLNLAPRIQGKYKVKGNKTKYILRELSKKYLPAELIDQPKRGFEVPLRNWVEGDLKPLIFDYLDNRDSFSSEFLSNEFIEALLHRPQLFPREKRAKMLYKLLVLEVWKKSW